MSEVQAAGKIVQCIGAVVDVEFPRNAMPKVYDALKLEGTALTLEVQQQLGDGVVRTIALGSSDGLRRGLMVSNTGNADHGAGGPRHARPHHGRAGQPDRRARPGRPGADGIDPPQAAGLRRAEPVAGPAGNRHQGDRPDLPLRQGRQGRPVRRRRRRQDREHDGADQQHRQGALAACRCLPAWASAPARATTSITRWPIRASSTSRTWASPRWRWSTAR